jgi:hypothetical protein
MQPEESAAGLVAQVDPRVDGINGLITITASEGKVVGLVTSRSELQDVRRELVELGVPDRMLDLQVFHETLVPYPVRDERVRRWIEGAEEAGALDAAVSVRGPSLGMTPRGISKAVLFLVIGLLALSMLFFLALLILES